MKRNLGPEPTDKPEFEVGERVEAYCDHTRPDNADRGTVESIDGPFHKRHKGHACWLYNIKFDRMLYDGTGSNRYRLDRSWLHKISPLVLLAESADPGPFE